MTREVFTPSPLYTISTAGPYAITHPYQVDTEIACTIFQGSTIVELVNGTDFTVSPSSSETTGDVTLSAAAFAAYTGASLLIRRESVADQGWAGQTAREKGLEAQLDAITQRLQEIDEAVARAIKLPEDPAPELPLDTSGLFLGFTQTNDFYAGVPVSTSVVTPYAATLLDDPDALTARTTLGALGPDTEATITAKYYFEANANNLLLWKDPRTGLASDSAVWGSYIGVDGSFNLSMVLDDISNSTPWMQAYRTGYKCDGVSFYIDGAEAAKVEAAGTAVTSDQAIITKEKGDSLYVSSAATTTTLTLTGIAGKTTVDVTWSLMGSFVAIAIPAISGTSNDNQFKISGLPVEIQAVTAQRFPAAVVDNGVKKTGQVRTAGADLFFKSDDQGSLFTASGTKTLNATTVVYAIPSLTPA